MRGWILLFALFTLLGAVSLAMGQSAIEFSMKTAILLSASLCLLCLLTRLIGRRI